MREKYFTVNSSCVTTCLDYYHWFLGQMCYPQIHSPFGYLLGWGPQYMYGSFALSPTLACRSKVYLSLEEELLFHLAIDCASHDGWGLGRPVSCSLSFYSTPCNPFPLPHGRNPLSEAWEQQGVLKTVLGCPWNIRPNYIHNINSKMLFSFLSLTLSRGYNGIF